MQSLFRRADSRYGLQNTRLYGSIEGAGVFLPPLPAMFGVKRRNNVFHFFTHSARVKTYGVKNAPVKYHPQ
ncbi:hypothetical protein PLGE761_15115 [Pluralibacter gergoviae]|nr:hypothetical protein AZ034_003314 [Pluralibacter gergoviae]OUF54436.1 hypothetical protein AZ044_000669 [Pluralibacter gergoviae]